MNWSVSVRVRVGARLCVYEIPQVCAFASSHSSLLRTHHIVFPTYRVEFAQLRLLLLVGDGENAGDGFPHHADLGQLAGSATYDGREDE